MLRDFSAKYLHLLTTKYEGLNLTRILEPQEFFEKQILDSILPLEHCQVFRDELQNKKVVIDIGFGGGFPLLPLAFQCPELSFLGIESKDKKVKAVLDIAESLGLKNVRARHLRIEEVLLDRPCALTLKAVGTVNDFLPLLNVTQSPISVFFYKGPSFHNQELPDFDKKLSNSWELFLDQRLEVPNTEERRIVGFRPRNVPRGTGKNLVKLSEFF